MSRDWTLWLYQNSGGKGYVITDGRHPCDCRNVFGDIALTNLVFDDDYQSVSHEQAFILAHFAPRCVQAWVEFGTAYDWYPLEKDPSMLTWGSLLSLWFYETKESQGYVITDGRHPDKYDEDDFEFQGEPKRIDREEAFILTRFLPECVDDWRY
jgi:hypothetical protein